MVRFGGNEFIGFSVPIVFEGRFFILEPGDPPLLSVLQLVGGQPHFEVLKNRPMAQNASVSGAGVVTVNDSTSGGFLYKVRPASDTSLVFGRLSGGEIEARISDTKIQVGGVTLQNNVFRGTMAGVVVDRNGGVAIGSPIPPEVRKLLGG